MNYELKWWNWKWIHIYCIMIMHCIDCLLSPKHVSQTHMFWWKQTMQCHTNLHLTNRVINQPGHCIRYAGSKRCALIILIVVSRPYLSNLSSILNWQSWRFPNQSPDTGSKSDLLVRFPNGFLKDYSRYEGDWRLTTTTNGDWLIATSAWKE